MCGSISKCLPKMTHNIGTMFSSIRRGCHGRRKIKKQLVGKKTTSFRRLSLIALSQSYNKHRYKFQGQLRLTHICKKMENSIKNFHFKFHFPQSRTWQFAKSKKRNSSRIVNAFFHRKKKKKLKLLF